MPLQSYARLRTPGALSEELLKKILRCGSAQKHAETVISSAKAFGVSPTSVSHKLVGLTAQKLQEFQERSLGAFSPFAIFLDAIHRGDEASRHAGREPERREDGPGVLAGLLGES